MNVSEEKQVISLRDPGGTLIAGLLSANDWRALRKTLKPGADEDLWKKAFDDYFRQRLSLRYLEPIRRIQERDAFEGEGFSIVAIQCTLVEFLASTIEGKNYRYRRKGDPELTDYEYKNSRDMFVRFLSEHAPFSRYFDPEIALYFYENVRCPLLHEARTKNGWSIWAWCFADGLSDELRRDHAPPIDPELKIIFRDNLQMLFRRFIDEYGEKVISDVALQEAFIRKFDNLAS